MAIERFEQLEVWREAHALVLDVYKLSTLLPSEEKFGLISQIRRAAISIPANIAEGFKRRGLGDKAHFYNISQGSLEEVRYYLILCRDLGYKLDYEVLNAKAELTGRLLSGLIRAVRS